MHHPTHDVFVTTQLCGVVFDAELKRHLAVLDPAHHIDVRVRTPHPREHAALRALAGRVPSLVAVASMTTEADPDALVEALTETLRPERYAWVRLTSTDGRTLDVWPSGLAGRTSVRISDAEPCHDR